MPPKGEEGSLLWTPLVTPRRAPKVGSGGGYMSLMLKKPMECLCVTARCGPSKMGTTVTVGSRFVGDGLIFASRKSAWIDWSSPKML